MTQTPTLVKAFLACALLGFAFTISALAQPTRWKEYKSENGKFSVMLPGKPATRYRTGHVGDLMDVVYETFYRTKTNYRDPNRLKYEREWGVNYFDLPLIPPDADAVKRLLKRVSGKYVAIPVWEKSLTLNGYPALEYKLKAVDERDRADLNRDMIVRLILVRRRVYELLVVTQPKRAASSDVTKFFGSFKPVPLTDEEVVAAALAKREIPDLRKLIDRDELEPLAIKKVQAAYPPEAKAARVSGEVSVRVLISEEGLVTDAQIITGHKILLESALAAARLWVFKPIQFEGRPVKADGWIIVKFTAQ